MLDQVYVRTTQTFANGKPRRQEFSGPLQVRLTNVASSRFRPGDTLPRGFYRLTGHHVIRFAADGTRTVLVDQDAAQNLCRALT